MKILLHDAGRSLTLVVVCICASISSISHAADSLDAIRKSAQAEIEIADTATMFKKVDLSEKYIVALTNLEKTLAADGQLDLIVRVREEREAVQKSGDTTSYQDKPLVELRGKYQKAMALIDGEMKTARAKAVAGIAPQIRAQETALTKAGKVDDALALRKEGERLMLELSGGAAAESVPFADDPRLAGSPDLNPLEPIKVPDEKPAPFENPFALKDRWFESMTVPVAKQRIREPIVIGDRGKKKWPLIVVSPGSIWAGAAPGRVELSGANFVANKCRFDSLELGADHACVYYFQNSAFTDCRFRKVGVWYGGDQAAKYYFENCHIKGSFSGTLNVVDIGLRVQNSVLEDIDLPSMRFRSHQPANYLNHKWMRLIHCRFVKCKIPLSFLLLTRDCVFENCTFVNDAEKSNDAAITKPIEIVLYVSNSKSRITDLPENVKLTEKPHTELKGVTIPTAASLAEMMAR